MIEYKPDDQELKNIVKKQIEKFILSSKTADNKALKYLLTELWDNYDDVPSNFEDLYPYAVMQSVNRWERVNLKCVELWKQIAINNSSVSNEPHKVADEAVASFKKAFILQK